MSLTEKLVDKLSSGPLRVSTSRRGFLAKAALGGAALATQPWQFITTPTSAYAACAGGGTDNSCGAGYTVFCCTVNDGDNSCPPGTFAGGWWKADRSSYCGGSARYYIDCNALPGHHFSCSCNDTGCDYRLHACNVFRYGQCNTHIHGTTPVVCRQVSCAPPWKIYPGACSTSSATDNNTSEHHAPCLDQPLTPLPKASNKLTSGQVLAVEQFLTSPARTFMLKLRADGNLVLLNRSNSVLWSTQTGGNGSGASLTMAENGDLVLRRADGKVLWHTHTTGRGGRRLVVQDSGNLVLVTASGHILWASNTDR